MTRRLIALNIAALLALGTAFLIFADRESVTAYEAYQQQHSRVLAALGAARTAGFTEEDLMPITSQLSSLGGSSAPIWIGERPQFYQGRAAVLAQLDSSLREREQELLSSTQQDTAAQLAGTQGQLDKLAAVDVPATATSGLATRLGAITAAETRAAGIGPWRALDQQARALAGDAVALAATQTQEQAAIQQAATALIGQSGGNLAAIQAAGRQSLVSGRNDATVAAYEALPNRFGAAQSVTDVYNLMEHYAPRLDGTDLNQVAFGAAAIQRYAAQVHQQLVQGLGPKHIVVSFQAQHVWAYQNGQVVMESAVTTGIRGVTAYGTDFGPMKVLWRSHPWKMHSPWPKGSPHWYPDTVVQWTAFFTYSGESFHDAYWEPDSALGPGSQFNAFTRSHGCIHLPFADAEWMFNWAVVGTPVDVFPGNGQPVAEQLAEMTTDNNGNPLNPA